MATDSYKLFTPLELGPGLTVKNRIMMAPMIRGRADVVTRVPSVLAETYYEQRASAGLIVSESVAVSEQGFGWYGAPGLYNQEQAAAWKKITDKVHAKGGKIFAQLWHLGRLGHSSFNAKDELVAPSPIPQDNNQTKNDQGETVRTGQTKNVHGQSVDYEVPRELTTEEIPGIVDDYRKSAELAKEAGFDGVEIHAASGYLIDQFLQSSSNHRTDKYGGSFENRARFLLEIVEAIKTVLPSYRIGVRLSPNAPYGGMGCVDNPEMFIYAIQQLRPHKLAYVSMLDGFGFGYHDKSRLLTSFDVKQAYGATVVANNSYTRDIAEGAIRSGSADMVAFGRWYITNPDLVERFKNDWPVRPQPPYEHYWDPSKGAEGYIDYLPYVPPPTSPLVKKKEAAADGEDIAAENVPVAP